MNKRAMIILQSIRNLIERWRIKREFSLFYSRLKDELIEEGYEYYKTSGIFLKGNMYIYFSPQLDGIELSYVVISGTSRFTAQRLITIYGMKRSVFSPCEYIRLSFDGMRRMYAKYIKEKGNH